MLKNIVIFFLLTVLLNQSAIAAVLPDFAVMAKENADAVVAISVSQKQAEPGMELQTPENTGSYGSGFVISEDGYILTNYHVIGAEPDQIMVRFKNHHIEMATLVGFDKVIDIALLKVNIPALQKVSLGSVASLDVGEWVMAIGAPFGFEQTVTKGIVSAKDRIMSNEVYVPYIQTDAATNHGNSGGPLFNARGQVVGINALIYSKTEGYQGLSFAIPIDLAMNAVAQLKSKGKVSRGWLGVASRDVTLKLASSFAMSRAYGALISDVAPYGPAQQAGLKIGDIVVAFNGQSVENSADLPPKVSMVSAGDLVDLEVIRQGERKLIAVKIAASPEN